MSDDIGQESVFAEVVSGIDAQFADSIHIRLWWEGTLPDRRCTSGGVDASTDVPEDIVENLLGPHGWECLSSILQMPTLQ